MKDIDSYPKQGDIYYIRRIPRQGSEQSGDRPGIIVSNDKGNQHAPIVEIVFLSQSTKARLPTHVRIYSAPHPSTALCEQITTIDKSRLDRKLGRVSSQEIGQLNEAIKISLGLQEKQNMQNNLKFKTEERTPIEIALAIDSEGMTTAKKLHAFLDLDKSQYARWCRRNILENGFAEENVDYWAFDHNVERDFNPNPTTDYKLTASFAKKLSMMSKNDKGEEARKYFLKIEDAMKDVTKTAYDLSPELRVLINLEMKQKQQDKELAEISDRVESIKGIVALNPNDWRRTSAGIINEIARNLGGFEHIKPIREEIYFLLEQRMGVALGIRLTNKQKTMSLNGVCKSKIDKLNKLDVIADDKKLIEGYVAIVKEMAIKHGA